MAELLSHLLLIWATFTVASWWIDWLTRGWIAVGLIGAILPDLNRMAIAIPEQAIGDLFGSGFQLDAVHTLGGVLLISALGGLRFARQQRRAFGTLLTTAVLHLLTDAVKSYADGAAAMWLYPFTSHRHPTPNLYVSADPEVFALSLGIAIVMFGLDRRVRRIADSAGGE